mgnify:CR=1 FL=1
MKHQLKGISFLLFAIVLMLYAVVGSPASHHRQYLL